MRAVANANLRTFANFEKLHSLWIGYLGLSSVVVLLWTDRIENIKWRPKTSQPCPQGLLLVQNGGRRNPWPRLSKWLQIFVRISSRKHEMSSFRLNNGFRLQKTNRAAIRWKQPPKKPYHRLSRDKILHDSWSISAALARGFSDCHFETGEGPGDKVEKKHVLRQNQRSDKWDVYANTKGNVSF